MHGMICPAQSPLLTKEQPRRVIAFSTKKKILIMAMKQMTKDASHDGYTRLYMPPDSKFKGSSCEEMGAQGNLTLERREEKSKRNERRADMSSPNRVRIIIGHREHERWF